MNSCSSSCRNMRQKESCGKAEVFFAPAARPLRRLMRNLPFALGGMALLTVAAAPAAAQAAGKVQDVRVVNGTEAPVPVIGTVGLAAGANTVTIGNTAAEPLPVAGSVGIASHANTVTIGNSEEAPVPVRPVGLPQVVPAAFRAWANAAGADHFIVKEVVTVPAGKRLVVEHVSGRVWMRDEYEVTVLALSFFHPEDGPVADVYFVPTRMEAGGAFDSHVWNSPTRLYAPAGSRVSLWVSRDPDNNFDEQVWSLHGMIFGYFEDEGGLP
jgi:hypothetical protein